MKWKYPHVIKIYEALGAVADSRVEIDGNSAKVYSSSRNKHYDVIYDSSKKAIMSNDNSSYWIGDLGYPSIAFLLKIGVISYDQNAGAILKGIHWKDINQKYNNDFDKALDYILMTKTEKEKQILGDLVNNIYQEIISLDLIYLGEKASPPKGY